MSYYRTGQLADFQLQSTIVTKGLWRQRRKIHGMRQLPPTSEEAVSSRNIETNPQMHHSRINCPRLGLVPGPDRLNDTRTRHLDHHTSRASQNPENRCFSKSRKTRLLKSKEKRITNIALFPILMFFNTPPFANSTHKFPKTT